MRSWRFLGRLLFFCSLCLPVVPVVHADSVNLIQNGDFTANGSGITYGVPIGWSDFSNGAISGYYAQFSNAIISAYSGPTGGYDYQNSAPYSLTSFPQLGQTFSDIKGDSYTVSLYVYNTFFPWESAGSLYEAEIDGKPFLELTANGATNWTEYTYSFTGTGTDSFSFGGNANNAYWNTADISIVPNADPLSSVVPEPSSASLMGIGVMAFIAGAFLLRLKRGTAHGHIAPLTN